MPLEVQEWVIAALVLYFSTEITGITHLTFWEAKVSIAILLTVISVNDFFKLTTKLI